MRPTIAELTDAFASSLTVVPRVKPGICSLCHGAAHAGTMCWSCHHTASRVDSPTALVVPISLCESRGQLHYALRKYKDARQPHVRNQFTRLLGALLARFLDSHTSCIESAAGFQWDYITTVPSTHDRPGRRPLEDVVSRVRELAQRHTRTLDAGVLPVKRLDPREENFEIVRKIRSDRILLVDDTFTSGTTVQAAASALNRAGATVVAAVVIGRFIHPDYDEAAQTLWNGVKDLTFNFDDCCVHQR